jgi:KDO2-lipid IV(A) lauroyltransferase
MTVGDDQNDKQDWRAAAKYVTYTGLASAMGRLPEPFTRHVVAGVTRVMSYRRSPAMAMNRRHIERVLASECPPGVEPDPALVRRLSRRTVGEYGRYWMDGARLPYQHEPGVRAHMLVEQGDRELRAAMAEGRGVIMALPHVGSWEWGGAWLALEGMPMTAVMEKLEPPALFEWFVGQRAAMGLTAVPLGDGSGAAVLRALREGKLVGLVSDRDLVGNGVEVDFFGEKTTLPAGPATLALRTGAALMPTVVYSGPGNWHTAVVHAPLDTTRSGSLRADVARLTQEVAVCFEEFIRRHPEQWHLYQPNWPSDQP